MLRQATVSGGYFWNALSNIFRLCHQMIFFVNCFFFLLFLMKNIKFLNLRHFQVLSKSSSSVLTSNINILNAIVAFVFSFQFQIETVFGHETSFSLSPCLCYNQTANNKPFEYKHGNQFNKIKFVWRVVLNGLNRRLLRIKRWRWLAGWLMCVCFFFFRSIHCTTGWPMIRIARIYFVILFLSFGFYWSIFAVLNQQQSIWYWIIKQNKA